jgi:uncharacterized protein
METDRNYTVFSGQRLIGTGELRSVLLQSKRCLDAGETAPVLIFDDSTGQQIDFDFRGTPDEVLDRLATHPMFVSAEATSSARTGPGRPKLGVVCREVSLLPRHWEWLEQQPQGISAALRRLIDDARKRDPEGERIRIARDAAAKFMWAMAGNLPGFEEASRALFANDHDGFENQIREWPEDIRSHLKRLLQRTA